MELCTVCIIERLPFIRCNFFCTYRKQRILAEQYSTNTYSIYCILYCRESNPNYVIYSWHATKLGIEYLTAFISCCTTIGKCDWNKNIFFIFFSMSARILFILKICMAEYTHSMWQNIRIRTLAAETPAWLSHPPSIVSK